MSHRLLLGVGVYFLALTYSCLFNYFDPDDMMNLYGAWHRFPDQVRPVGAIFYRVIFEAVGFHPLPFHAAAFVLLLSNLVLLAGLLRRLVPASAPAALFFGCFQGTMWLVYASTGMIYDVLCATFLYAAFLVAITKPNWWPLILALHLGAVGSKELGITLPALLLLYSLLYRRLPWRSLLVTSVVSLAFAAQRVFIPNVLTGHEAYTPVLSLARLSENVTVYTRLLFSHVIPFTPGAAVAFWLALFALAAALRSKRMAFGLAFFWIALSPMLVGTPRHAGYVFYMPFLGLALFAGELVAHARATFLKRLDLESRYWWRPALIAPFVVAVFVLHIEQRQIAIRRGETPAAQEQTRQLAAIRLPLTEGQRVLLLNSPGIGSAHLGVFTLTLTHTVRNLTVVERPGGPGDRDIASGFDYVMYFPPNEPRPIDLSATLISPWSIGAAPAPAAPSPFVMEYTVPDATIGGTPSAPRFSQAGAGTLRILSAVQPVHRPG